jgi:hypothetical protein
LSCAEDKRFKHASVSMPTMLALEFQFGGSTGSMLKGPTQNRMAGFILILFYSRRE